MYVCIIYIHVYQLSQGNRVPKYSGSKNKKFLFHIKIQRDVHIGREALLHVNTQASGVWLPVIFDWWLPR